MSQLIPLTRGYSAIVDDEDFERFGHMKWCASPRSHGIVYAVRSASGRHQRHQVYLHRAILGVPPGRVPQVDHIDRDGLNNQRVNLRLATKPQNNANAIKPDHGLSSRFKGVTQTAADTWNAHIKSVGRMRNLGHYRTEDEAARVYDDAAKIEWGEFALVNFPQEWDGLSRLIPNPAVRIQPNGELTQCRRGHPFDEQNTRRRVDRPTGGRRCRECERERRRDRRRSSCQI